MNLGPHKDSLQLSPRGVVIAICFLSYDSNSLVVYLVIAIYFLLCGVDLRANADLINLLLIVAFLRLLVAFCSMMLICWADLIISLLIVDG